MPCFTRTKKQFEILKEETQKNRGEMTNTQRDEQRKKAEDFWTKVKERVEEHEKALERLQKRLREAASELERQQIQKEIDELEKELAGFHDILEQLVEFQRDIERRTIQAPTKSDQDAN